MKRDAVFDESEKYRYSLYREWDNSLPRILFIMLNPSTANHDTEDHTSRQCLYFSKKFGYGSLEIVNLYAYVSTDPKQLKESDDPIGKKNNAYILEAAKRAKTVVIAWGEKHLMKQRNKEITKLLREYGHQVYCLDVTKSGHPRHPSRMRHSIDSLKVFAAY